MSHPDTEALAEAVVEELDPGQVIDNKVILSRRQLVAIAGSGLSAGALAALGLEEASAQTGPAGQVGTSSEPVDAYTWDLDVQNGADFNGNYLTNVGAADIDQADVTGETFISANRSTSVTGVAASTNTNIVDTKSDDNLGEFDSNQEFTPTKSGWYRFEAGVTIAPGADRDRLLMSVRDGSNTFIEQLDQTRSSGTDEHDLTGAITVDLAAGTAYKVTCRDLTNSFDVTSGRLRISRSVVHP